MSAPPAGLVEGLGWSRSLGNPGLWKAMSWWISETGGAVMVVVGPWLPYWDVVKTFLLLSSAACVSLDRCCCKAADSLVM